ncbi:MAG: endonuclease MutS2 [Candidatus Dormiibacterota bacterium]
MHERSLSTLEFPKVLNLVAQQAAFSVGRERVLALRPVGDLAAAEAGLQETADALALLEERPRAGVGGVRDVRDATARAARGGLLSLDELQQVLATLRAGAEVHRLLEDLDPERLATLLALDARLPDLGELAGRLDRVIDEESRVRDTASPRLARVRSSLVVQNQRLAERLRALVGEHRSALQEPIVTMRGGRYVIPVRADQQGQVRGIVHDQSSSGATVYIEPIAVVEANNRLRQLEAEERNEVERILREASDDVAAHREPIVATVEELGELDCRLSRARWARAVRASRPRLNRDRRVVLHGARHPLLGDHVVPIDFRLDADVFMVVVTGPNTGGKTVALKSVGLLTLLAQSGLWIPAEPGSEIAVMDEVYADIGDEQSLEQNLSTFSSHLARIIEMLRRVDQTTGRGEAPNMLVLLDELGSGTDPDEGSALARAILSHLRGRRVPTVATTHLSELKAFAHESEGVVNASVTFDVETLSPTYRLEIGVPGRSNALAIASRLGLRPSIVREARQYQGSAGVRLEGLLADLERERAAARRERRESAEARAALDREQAALDEARARLEEQSEAMLEETRGRARAELEVVEQELRSIRAAARRSGGDTGGITRAATRARRVGNQIAPSGRPTVRHRPGITPHVLPGTPAPGDRVRISRLDQVGDLLRLTSDGSEADVQLGSLRTRLPLRELQRVEGGPLPDERDAPPTVVHTAPRAQPSVELDLRGQRVAEAVENLDRYLDEAALTGTPWVRIIHGIGTGAVKAAVREHLRGHPLVAGVEDAAQSEGGAGATQVRLVG